MNEVDQRDRLHVNMDAFCNKNSIESFLTVDPGFNTGAAYWHRNCDGPGTEYFIVPGKGTSHKLKWAWDRFDDLLECRDPDAVFIESTQLWQESLTSLTSGSTGDLLTLTLLIGGYARICQTRKMMFELLPAQQWKGQMNKDTVARRIFREIGLRFPNSHVTDAVGMGMSLINEWRVST